MGGIRFRKCVVCCGRPIPSEHLSQLGSDSSALVLPGWAGGRTGTCKAGILLGVGAKSPFGIGPWARCLERPRPRRRIGGPSRQISGLGFCAGIERLRVRGSWRRRRPPGSPRWTVPRLWSRGMSLHVRKKEGRPLGGSGAQRGSAQPQEARAAPVVTWWTDLGRHPGGLKDEREERLAELKLGPWESPFRSIC